MTTGNSQSQGGRGAGARDGENFQLVAEIGDAMGMPIVVLTYPDMRFVMSNEANCRLLGQLLGRDVAEQDLLGRTVEEAAPPLTSLADVAGTVGQTGQTIALEPIRFPTADGGSTYLKIHYCPIRRGSRVIRLAGIGVDVTREVLATRALKESEERFRLSLRSSPVIVYSADANLRYTWLYSSLLGPLAKRFVGKRVDEIIDSDSAREVVEIKLGVLRTGQGVRREIELRDGRIRRVFDLTVDPVRDEAGKIIGLNGAAVDITECKRVEVERAELLAREQAARAEAERQTAQIKALLANLGEGVTIRDANGRIVLRNRKAAEITGVADEEAATIDCYPHPVQFQADGSPVPPGRELLSRIARGESIDDEEYVFRRKDGKEVRVAYTSGAVKDEDGRVTMSVTAFRDVTELRRLERSKDEFLSVMAHELRNPLAAAAGLLQLSIRRLAPEAEQQVGRHLRLALIELDRLGGLISDIITGYRVSSGRLPLKLERVDLGGIVRDSVAPYEGSSDHKWLVSPEVGADLPVWGDGQRLTEVLANLFSNAVKYSPPSSRIWVHIDRCPDSVVVRVEDEGIGIPPDQLERVFDGFYRATNLNNRQPGGIGLGLYISRDVARRHGGDLWAETRPVGGTVMCLRLPLAQEQVG